MLDHSQASFAAGVNDDDLVLDFGVVQPGGTVEELPFTLYNLLSASGYTAGLDLDLISATGGDTGAFSLDAAAFANLAAGSFADFEANFVGTSLGTFEATYRLLVSDQNLPGATNGRPADADPPCQRRT